MKKNYNFICKGSLCILLFLIGFTSFSQTTTVFSDDFALSQGTLFSTGNVVPIGSSPIWKMSRSGSDFGARISGGRLDFTGDATSAAYSTGWVFGTVATSAFSAPYTSTLKNNPGTVTWSFNMRQSRNNPNSINSVGFGIAYVLAGTTGSTLSSGTGYAVTLGNAGSIDPIRLVKYTEGLKSTTSILASTTANLTDFGNSYLSVRVTYTPSTGTWQLFVRNDGVSAFVDAGTGTLTAQGSVVDDTYTSNSLPIMGGFMYSGKTRVYTAYFDNAKVSVGIPLLNTISPSAAFAGGLGFTLTANGQNFTPTSKLRWNGSDRVTTYVSATQLTAVIPSADIATVGSVSVTVVNGSTASNAKIFTINSAGTPTLTVTPESLILPTTVTGSAMTASQYTISGANLVNADPVATAPTNFEISLDNVNFFSSLNLPRSGNVLASQPRTIYVRKVVNAPAGIYDALVTHTATGTSNIEELQINAKVLATQPTTLSTSLSFTDVTSTAFRVNWANGNGTRRLVLLRQSSAVNSLPVDGQTYTPNSIFGSGSEIGTGNYVVYSGNGTTTLITGLSAATTYHVSIIEYNGTDGIENYGTSGLIGNRLTLNAPIGWQIYSTNASNTIDFDATVDGVNANAFQGYGFSPTGASGELNSKAWAITGFSDGAIAFNGTSGEDTDYDSGTSTGAVLDGGIYAFETSPDNFSLGVQPSSADFSPGTITLRIQNQTGATINSLNVGYKVFVYNDQNSSSNFNFSHSSDNTTYTSVSAIDVTSPGTADAMAEWKGYYRATTFTGLSIAANSYYYIRWTGGDSGNVTYDEFALDDISLVANPTSTFVPFSNSAESFVLNGNATLSGDLQVENNLTFSNSAKLSIGANTLSIKGTVTNTTANGLKGSGSSNLIINGANSTTLSFDQTTPGTTNLFNNISIVSTANNTATITTPIVVNGTLNVAENQSLDMGLNALTGTLSSAIINGTLWTKNTTSLPIPSGKVWTGTGTVNYNSVTTAQTVVAGTYNGLTVTPTAGATAGGNLIVNGILNLPTANPTAIKGSLSLGANTLTMGGNATNTGIGDVTGDVLRTSIVPNVLYTFGHKDTSILFPNVGTLPTTMGLRIDIGTAPAWKPDGVKRIYDFKQTGGSGTKAVIKGHYLDSELNGNNESKLVDYVNRTVAPIGTFEQGRSNYNTTENWVELTNADIAQAFYSNFDIVKLGFAETAVAFATWTGATSDSWITNTNWSPQTVPSLTTTVVIPNATTTNNDPLIVSGSEVLKITIEAGGIVNAPTNSQFTVYGGAGAWVNNGTFNPGAGTSTVTFLNLDATIAGSTTFNNLIIASGAGLRPLTGNVLSIAGTFTKTGTFTPAAIDNTVIFTGTNQTIPALTVGVQGYNNLIINGTGAVFPTSLRITGDLTLNNPIDFSGKTIEMTGVTPQIIGGTAANFNNLTVNNTNGGVSLSSATSVTGTLTLTSGQLKLGTNNLTLGLNAVSGTFDSSKMIVTDGTGEVRRAFTTTGSYLFPVGENTTHAYCPITVNVTAGSFASAYVGASVKSGKHPNNYSLQNYLNRYWVVNQSGITGALATISASYLPSDLSSAENNIVAAQLNGNFNQINNPWIKFSNLNSNTLTVGNATLTSGQTSTFTGISAENFTTTITGFGSFL